MCVYSTVQYIGCNNSNTASERLRKDRTWMIMQTISLETTHPAKDNPALLDVVLVHLLTLVDNVALKAPLLPKPAT